MTNAAEELTPQPLRIIVRHSNGSSWEATSRGLNKARTRAILNFGIAGEESLWVTDDERRGTFTRRAMRHWSVSEKDVERIIREEV